MGELMETIMHRRAIRRFDTRQIEETHCRKSYRRGCTLPALGESRG